MVDRRIMGIAVIIVAAGLAGLLLMPVLLPSQNVVAPYVTVHQIWASIQTGEDWLIVDTRSPQSYADGHIPTSINLQFNESIDKSTVVMLEGFNPATTVLYCSCWGGGSAKMYVEELIIHGMRDVYYMNDSIFEWPYAMENNSIGGT